MFHQRLEDEFGASVIATAPTVPYVCTLRDGTELAIANPAEYPEGPKSSGAVCVLYLSVSLSLCLSVSVCVSLSLSVSVSVLVSDTVSVFLFSDFHVFKFCNVLVSCCSDFCSTSFHPSRLSSTHSLNTCSFQEPMVKATIVAPQTYLGSILELCQSARGTQARASTLPN